jgi:hypothetical protein
MVDIVQWKQKRLDPLREGVRAFSEGLVTENAANTAPLSAHGLENLKRRDTG